MAAQTRKEMQRETDAEFAALVDSSQLDSNDIDKRLTDKALKNQLTKPNVKNLIKSVLMNEDVATMLRQTLTDDGDCLFEPKLTRAKIKEMLKNYPSAEQWSPYQQQSIISECRLLIEKEFPDDSEDEEYCPDKCLDEEDDFDDDDESKCTEINKSIEESEVESNVDISDQTSEVDVNDKETIGMRTRSKLSLNDTPLETIEQAFIPPDITEDMYDSACENDEWMEFLSEFTKPLESVQNDDLEDDPEYNVLCDDDFSNVDQEEFRIDRSVKISRKEYNELMNELNEITDSYLEFNGPQESQEPETENDDSKNLAEHKNSNIPVYTSSCSDWKTNSSVQTTDNVQHMINSYVTESINEQLERKKILHNLVLLTVPLAADPTVPFDKVVDTPSLVPLNRMNQNNVFEKTKIKCDVQYMTEKQLILLKDQLTKHVQLTTQNYLLCTMAKQFKNNAKKSKDMLKAIKDVCQDKNYIPINIHSALKFIKEWDEGQLNMEDMNRDHVLIPNYVKKLMLFYEEPVFIHPNLLPSKTYYLDPPPYPFKETEEMLLVLKIDEVYNKLKEKPPARHKKSKQSLCDLMPIIVKTVHKRWFSHKSLICLKQLISKRRKSFQPSILRNYLVHGKIETQRHKIDMDSVFRGRCLDKCNIQQFPLSWKPLVRQIGLRII